MVLISLGTKYHNKHLKYRTTENLKSEIIFILMFRLLAVIISGVTGIFFFWVGGQKPNFPDKLYNMFKTDYLWNYPLSSTSTMLYVKFHKPQQVFYQGLQT